MNRKKYIVFVILYTIFNIGVLMGASDYIQQSYVNQAQREEQVINKESSGQIDTEVSEAIIEESENKNDNLAQNNAENQISMNEGSYETDKEVLNYSLSYKQRTSRRVNSSTQQSTKVFKVTADEIISDLNPIEKAKILWVCRKLTKEEYNEIEEYLSYQNEKLGVMKVYAILEEKLDDESLEDVKEIFSKYIDTEKVKEIFY